MHLQHKYKKLALSFFLILSIFFIFFLSYLSLHREFDHDEFQHTHIAWSMKEGAQLYKSIGDHHGPLYSIINSTIWKTFKLPDSFFTIFIFRFISLFFLFGIIVLCFFIARTIYDKQTAYLSCLILTSSYTFLHKAMEIRPDTMMTFFWLLGFMFLTKYAKTHKIGHLLICGISYTIAFFLGPKAIIPIMITSICFLLYTSKHCKDNIYNVFILLGFVIALTGFMVAYIPLAKTFINTTILISKEFLLGTSLLLPTPQKHFPLFYRIPLLEINTWGLILVATLFSIKNQKGLSIGVLISTIIILNLHRYSQWYVMLIPILAITIASGAIYIKDHIKSGFWQKTYISYLLIVFIFGSITTISTLLQYPNNKAQITFTEYVMQNTRRTDQILLIWCNAGGYMFREPPTSLRKVWYGIGEERFPTTTIFKWIDETRPHYIIAVYYSRWLKDFLEKYYLEKIPFLWERK